MWWAAKSFYVVSIAQLEDKIKEPGRWYNYVQKRLVITIVRSQLCLIVQHGQVEDSKGCLLRMPGCGKE